MRILRDKRRCIANSVRVKFSSIKETVFGCYILGISQERVIASSPVSTAIKLCDQLFVSHKPRRFKSSIIFVRGFKKKKKSYHGYKISPEGNTRSFTTIKQSFLLCIKRYVEYFFFFFWETFLLKIVISCGIQFYNFIFIIQF